MVSASCRRTFRRTTDPASARNVASKPSYSDVTCPPSNAGFGFGRTAVRSFAWPFIVNLSDATVTNECDAEHHLGGTRAG